MKRIRVEYRSGIPSSEHEVADIDAFVTEKWGHIFHLNDLGGYIVDLGDVPAPEVVEKPKKPEKVEESPADEPAV